MKNLVTKLPKSGHFTFTRPAMSVMLRKAGTLLKRKKKIKFKMELVLVLYLNRVDFVRFEACCARRRGCAF